KELRTRGRTSFARCPRQARQTRAFGGCDPAAGRGQAVIAPPAIVAPRALHAWRACGTGSASGGRWNPAASFDNPAGLEHPEQRAVQRTGLDAAPVRAKPRRFLHDAVAVT